MRAFSIEIFMDFQTNFLLQSTVPLREIRSSNNSHQYTIFKSPGPLTLSSNTYPKHIDTKLNNFNLCGNTELFPPIVSILSVGLQDSSINHPTSFYAKAVFLPFFYFPKKINISSNRYAFISNFSASFMFYVICTNTIIIFLFLHIETLVIKKITFQASVRCGIPLKRS